MGLIAARQSVPGLAERAPSFAVLGVSLTIVTWGLASPLIKSASLSGPALSFYRISIGALLLATVVRAGRTNITPQTWRWGALAGAVFGINLVMFVISIKMTTVANATLIGALQPAIVLLVAAPWFGETVTRREVGLVAVAIAGVGVVIVGSAGSPEWNLLGDFLAMLAVLTFTAYFLISKHARSTVGTLEYMAVVHVAATVIVAPIALADPEDLWSFGWQDVAIVLFFALVSGTIGQLVIGWAHRYVDVSLSSLMMLGVPVVAALSAWAILGEELGLVQIAGAIITLGAIGAMVRRPAISDGAGVPRPSDSEPSTPGDVSGSGRDVAARE